MRIESEYPFLDYNCYKLHNVRMNRDVVCLHNPETNERRTILFSKYLMSIQEGRILDPEEEVDHIDGDKTNDSLDNLEIVTAEENRRRHNLTRSLCTVDLVCPNCGIEFIREKRQTHIIKGGTRTFCSRRCAGQFKQYGTKLKIKLSGV